MGRVKTQSVKTVFDSSGRSLFRDTFYETKNKITLTTNVRKRHTANRIYIQMLVVNAKVPKRHMPRVLKNDIAEETKLCDKVIYTAVCEKHKNI